LLNPKSVTKQADDELSTMDIGGLVIAFAPVLANASWERFGQGIGRYLAWTILVSIGFATRALWRQIRPRRETYVLGTCSCCDGSIEFPERGIGETVECPRCKETTLLAKSG
jgi:hypothetical protein